MQFSSVFTSSLTLFAGANAYNNIVCPKYPFLQVENHEYPMSSAIIESDVESLRYVNKHHLQSLRDFVKDKHQYNNFADVPDNWKIGLNGLKGEKITELLHIPGLGIQTALLKGLGLDCSTFKLINEVIIRDVFAGKDFKPKYLYEIILLEFIFTNMLNVQCFDVSRLDPNTPSVYRRAYDHEYALVSYNAGDKYVNPDIPEPSVGDRFLMPINLTREHLNYRKIKDLTPISLLDDNQHIIKNFKKKRLVTIDNKGHELAILKEVHAARKTNSLRALKEFREKRVKINGRVIQIDNKVFLHLDKLPVLSHANKILGGWPYNINTSPVSKGTRRVLTCVTKVGGSSLEMGNFQTLAQDLADTLAKCAAFKTQKINYYQGFPVTYTATEDMSPKIISGINI